MPTLPESELTHSSPPRSPRLGPGAIALVCIITGLVLLVAVGAALSARQETPPSAVTPSPIVTSTPTPEPSLTPAPAPEPTPEPTPDPVIPFDFTQPVPESAPVESGYFDDAVFIGDSRTDGLRLYGGVEGADFIEHTGISVFDVGTKKVIRIAGEKYTVLEALALKQYKKIYLMLGVNELGHNHDEGFRLEYEGLVDKIKELQPDAILYLQNLVCINPDKAKANNQPYYVTNEKIAVYNAIIAAISVDKHAALVDVNAALVDGNGILPREGTTDGVHFTKDYCKRWYDYLKIHAADADSYWAGQTAQ